MWMRGLLWSAVLGGALIIGPSAFAEPSVEITLGHGGYYLRGANVPATITLSTFEEGFRGSLLLEAAYSEAAPDLRLSFPVALTPYSSTSRRVILPGDRDLELLRAAAFVQEPYPKDVRGSAPGERPSGEGPPGDGDPVKEGPAVFEEVNARRGGLDDSLIVCYSDDPDILPEERLPGYRVVYARASTAPENPAGYEGVAAVVAGGGPAEDLTRPQVDALASWAAAGGTVVFVDVPVLDGKPSPRGFGRFLHAPDERELFDILRSSGQSSPLPLSLTSLETAEDRMRRHFAGLLETGAVGRTGILYLGLVAAGVIALLLAGRVFSGLGRFILFPGFFAACTLVGGILFYLPEPEIGNRRMISRITLLPGGGPYGITYAYTGFFSPDEADFDFPLPDSGLPVLPPLYGERGTTSSGGTRSVGFGENTSPRGTGFLIPVGPWETAVTGVITGVPRGGTELMGRIESSENGYLLSVTNSGHLISKEGILMIEGRVFRTGRILPEERREWRISEGFPPDTDTGGPEPRENTSLGLGTDIYLDDPGFRRARETPIQILYPFETAPDIRDLRVLLFEYPGSESDG
jgi:hypothetical protein